MYWFCCFVDMTHCENRYLTYFLINEGQQKTFYQLLAFLLVCLYIYIYILPYDFIMWFKLQSRYVNVHFCQLSNVFGCMSLVNVTSLRFSQFIFHKFAVFNNCQKHLDDKSHLNCNGFRLQIVKKKKFSDRNPRYREIPPAAVTN